MSDFERDGWQPVFIAVTGDAFAKPGWKRGSFYIYQHEYEHYEIGATSAALLMHCATGYMLAPFGCLEGAACAAEIAEPLADWAKVFGSKSRDDAVADAWNVLRDVWPFFPINLTCGGEQILLHNDRAGGSAAA